MAIRESISEFLTRVEKSKGREAKITILEKEWTPPFIKLIDACFNDNVEWLLPEGPVPSGSYNRATSAQDFHSTLITEMRKLSIFHNAGEYNNLNQKRREQIYLNFLETLDPDDADLVECIRTTGKLPNNGLTKKLFADAYPDLAKKWSKTDG